VVRLIFFGAMASGIGGAVLVFGLWLQNLPVYYVSFIFLAIVLFVAIINTFFKEKGRVGYVHPDDLLFGNIFAFLFVLAVILGAGYFYSLGQLPVWPGTTQAEMTQAMFNYASVIFVAFIFLWGLSQLGFIVDVLQGKGREVTKETTARFILFALILGVFLSLILAGFNSLYIAAGFVTSAWVLGAISAGLLIILGVVLRGRYEEVPS
jgi:hypothetical protein